MNRISEMDMADIPHCEGLTPEQVIERDDEEGNAWLIDQWGIPRSVITGTVVGRNLNDCNLVILHASVSTQHARIEHPHNEGWRIVDLGSLNGTTVNERMVRNAPLMEGDIIVLGEVGFLFTLRPPDLAEEPRGPGFTVRSQTADLPLQLTLRQGEHSLQLIRRSEGGLIVVGKRKIRLATLEYSLLRALIRQQLEAGESGNAFLSSRELVAKLEFRSRAADSENVRELVHRVRQKLNKFVEQELIESERGSGYRLAWAVSTDPIVTYK
ncbi:FHA domain-containing protein [Haliangium ochraceum]|uniref:FHA domain containing protein n=1 Tax=Haliangium ochraceum (strain DSM 14365 / JCM 11303 / SMP-2) TaxID=502025 RepID=D0LHC2_HALO1|nr:FHA domain-containing protein [Haliangium ochraceum]ACY18267.1 FHA domain containing protein [Haliangium ochraceum DSM 14365]